MVVAIEVTFSATWRKASHQGSCAVYQYQGTGGVRTAISENARLSKSLDPAEVDRERANWRSLLALAPEKAAETIAVAIERRAPRVLVGNDAKGTALVQRLFPVSYWKHVARDIARRTRRKSA